MHGMGEWWSGWMDDWLQFVWSCWKFMSFIRMWSINRAVISKSEYYTEKEPASYFLQIGEKIETLLQSVLDTEDC